MNSSDEFAHLGCEAWLRRAMNIVQITYVITTRLFSPWLCRLLAVSMVNLCVSFTYWLTAVRSASSPHWIMSLAMRNCGAFFFQHCARTCLAGAQAAALRMGSHSRPPVGARQQPVAITNSTAELLDLSREDCHGAARVGTT
jgi:hypothetical protein